MAFGLEAPLIMDEAVMEPERTRARTAAARFPRRSVAATASTTLPPVRERTDPPAAPKASPKASPKALRLGISASAPRLLLSGPLREACGKDGAAAFRLQRSASVSSAGRDAADVAEGGLPMHIPQGALAPRAAQLPSRHHGPAGRPTRRSLHVGGRRARRAKELPVAALERLTVAALRACAAFDDLSDADLRMVTAAGKERSLPRYSVLYREGGAARAFYVLLSGRVQHTYFDASRPPIDVGGGEAAQEAVCFGLEALTQLRRTSTLSALEDALVLTFTVEATAGLNASALASNIFASFVERELQTLPMCAAPG